MTELKKLVYQLEDTIILGKTLPVVALRQLPKIADKILDLPEEREYIPGTAEAFALSVLEFHEKNIKLLDDERQLRENFVRQSKRYGMCHETLAYFECNHPSRAGRHYYD